MELYNQPVVHLRPLEGIRWSCVKRVLKWHMLVVAILMPGCAPEGPGAQPTPTPVTTRPLSSTPEPGTMPAPAALVTPSMEEWLHPYTLQGLRERRYAAGRLASVRETLKTGIFTRYAISYRSDGLLISGTLQIPAEGRPPFPVIIMNHGYFNRTEYRSGDGTDRAAEYLNRHGYLTLSSDYRSWGSSDSGPSLYYSGLVIDVENLMMTAGSIPEADADRVGMWGHSMGGGVTMKVLTLNTPVRAAVLYSPVSADDNDILARWGLGCIGDIAAGENQLGCNSSDVIPLDLAPELIKAYYEASLDGAALETTSPINHLDRVSVPVQIHYGMDDGEDLGGTPPEWARKLFEALEAAGKPAEIFAYEDQAHSFVGDSWVAFMERSGRFFDENVKLARQ